MFHRPSKSILAACRPEFQCLRRSNSRLVRCGEKLSRTLYLQPNGSLLISARREFQHCDGGVKAEGAVRSRGVDDDETVLDKWTILSEALAVLDAFAKRRAE